MRPSNQTVGTWADGNYPAGGDPWSGQAKRVIPSTLYFTPNTKLPAEHENYIVRDLQDGIVGLYDMVGQLQAHNYPYKATKAVVAGPSGNCAITDVRCTDAGRWCVLLVDDVSGVFKSYLATSMDGGLTWVHHKDGGNNHFYTSACTGIAGYSTTEIIAATDDATNYKKLTISSGAWSNVAHNVTGGQLPQAVLNFSGLVIVFQSGTNGKMASYNGTSFTDRSSQFTSFGTKTNGYVHMAASTTVAVLTGGSDKLYTSTDGTTWTSRSIPGTWDPVAGQTYSKVLGKFFALTDGSTCRIFSSSDGITWSSPIATLPADCLGLGSSGSLLVTTAQTAVNGHYKQYYSVDGGVNWKEAAQFWTPLPGATETNGWADYHGQNPKRQAGAAGQVTQLCAFNSAAAYFSVKTGLT